MPKSRWDGADLQINYVLVASENHGDGATVLGDCIFKLFEVWVSRVKLSSVECLPLSVPHTVSKSRWDGANLQKILCYCHTT